MYTLYYSPGACSIAPHIALEEIGAPYQAELMRVDMKSSAENITDLSYLKINPKGRVPALTFADGILTEAPAILVYLARRHPEAHLLPPSAEAEARCLEWLAYLATGVHAVAFGQTLRPQRFSAEAAHFPAIVAKGRQNIAAAFAFVEERLQGRDYAVGEAFSISDAYLLFYYLAAERYGLPMAERFPAWSRVAANTLSRPAVQRTLKLEGLTRQGS